jgi:DNA-directed RNA polymerase I subunit RPA2
MPSAAKDPTNTKWSHEFETLRREKLFRDPPADHTAYPALQEAVQPHLGSFNGIFRDDGQPGLLAHALRDIGWKTYMDGNDQMDVRDRNRLTIRFKDVTLQKPQLPSTNKAAHKRHILPAECRERHSSYRGRLTATLEYSINGGDPVEFVREMGQVPVMIKVILSHAPILALD